MKKEFMQKRVQNEHIRSQTATEKIDDELLEKVRQEAFMEGYKYAIQVLEEGLVQKEKIK